MADQIFAGIKKNVEAKPELVNSIKAVYQFNVGDKNWTVDLKNAPGSVKEGKADKADCTVTLKEADLVAMSKGELDGQQAFMQGKLKISGNMAFAMKLGSVITSEGGAVGAASEDPVAAVFNQIEAGIKADSGLVGKVNGVYQFNIDGAKWTVDLKNAPGSVSNSEASSPDCTLTLKSSDFVDLMTGKIDGQQAFMQGKLKIGGNMSFAMKLKMITGAPTPKL